MVGTGLPATAPDAPHVTGRRRAPKASGDKAPTFAQRLASIKSRTKELTATREHKIPLRMMVPLPIYEFVVELCERCDGTISPNQLALKCFMDGLHRYGQVRSMKNMPQMFEDHTFTVTEKYPQLRGMGNSGPEEERLRETVNNDLQARRQQQIDDVPGLRSQANANRR